MKTPNTRIAKNMKKMVNIRLPIELVDRLKKASDEQQRTITVLVENAIRKIVEEHETNN